MTYPSVLKCDVGGLPVRWISWQRAVYFYARGRVRWEAGDNFFEVTGGRGALGEISVQRVASIVAIADKSRRFSAVPRLTNRGLFERDKGLCLYCGQHFAPKDLTRDHVIPTSKGGEDTWKNCVTACRECNQDKDDRTPENANMKLLALPFSPNLAEHLILSNRKILADQMDFLQAFSKKHQA